MRRNFYFLFLESWSLDLEARRMEQKVGMPNLGNS